MFTLLSTSLIEYLNIRQKLYNFDSIAENLDPMTEASVELVVEAVVELIWAVEALHIYTVELGFVHKFETKKD
jgi:hypothetical protein